MFKKRTMDEKRNLYGWIFVSLSIVCITVFVFYPMVQAFITSLKGGEAYNLQWVGFDNYKRMLTDATFKKAAYNTVFYLVLQVPIMILLAMLIAVFLNDKTLKFKGFYRTAIFLPAITSLVSYSVIFRSLFSDAGLVNRVLMGVGLLSSPISFITHPFWAKIIIVISLTWRWTGYNMIFFLAGLQNIDPQVYEAAFHPYDLGNHESTYLTIAGVQSGVGGDDSWGAPVLDQYCVDASKPYSFSFRVISE